MNDKDMIYVLNLGGSFEKIYANGKGVRELSFPEEESAAERILNSFMIKEVEVHYQSDQAKDSLDMNNSDRERLARMCGQFSARFVIIHGTDTMIKTAKVLAKKNWSDRLIVLTGSRQPACVRYSDAEFNLGGAIAAARILPMRGVYIVMNGQVFEWDKCEKNPGTGLFEPK